MNREFSPEERLLHLIKGKKKPKDERQPDNIIVPVPLPPAISSSEADIDKPKLKASSLKQRINVNPFYIAIVIISLFLLTILFFIFNPAKTKDDQEIENITKLIASISEISQQENVNEAESISTENEKKAAQNRQSTSFDDYQKLINNKAIFAPPVTDTKKAAPVGESSLQEMAKDLKLVGIIPGDTPQAIIEDKKNNQTLFLREGEMINNMEVKAISTGRVVLAYGEETITLSL
jgi:hypothetical protein